MMVSSVYLFIIHVNWYCQIFFYQFTSIPRATRTKILWQKELNRCATSSWQAADDFPIIVFEHRRSNRFNYHELPLVECVGAIEIPYPLGCP